MQSAVRRRRLLVLAIVASVRSIGVEVGWQVQLVRIVLSIALVRLEELTFLE